LDLRQVTDIGCREKGQFVIGGRGVGCWLAESGRMRLTLLATRFEGVLNLSSGSAYCLKTKSFWLNPF
jgi:hypothetical protein